MFDVSIVVLTYNPSFDKLTRTLSSAIMQVNVEFEIVIADDGSKSFERDRLISWFEKKSFYKYKLVINPENRGTMKNAISGWRAAQGKYIKQLSPGDCLYGKTTLAQAVHILENKETKLAFGIAAPYSIENDQISLFENQTPKDLSPYYEENKKKIKDNYVEKFDYINGMAFICDRELMIKYGSILENRVKYAEDCTYILMIADGVDIAFIDDFIIWYEYGTGISTGKSDIWKKRIAKDNRECYKQIASLHPELNYISKYYFNKDRSFPIRFISKAMKIVLNQMKNTNDLVTSTYSRNKDVSNLKFIIENSR